MKRDRMSRAPQISFCLIIFNEARTLRANLDHLYPHAREIIICEGSIALLRTELGVPARSDDGTLDVLGAFPDPLGKLRILQRDWRDKDEMAAAYAAMAGGDLIWHVDADEFYDEGAFEAARREFADESLNTLIMPHLIFWKTPRHVLASAEGDPHWCRVPRVLRRCAGMSVRHVPVRRIVEGRVDESGMRGPRDPSLVCHHYGWNDDSRTRLKYELYRRRDARTHRDDWLRTVWDRWTPGSAASEWPEGVHPSRQWRLWPIEYRGPHPAAIEPVLADLNVYNVERGAARGARAPRAHLAASERGQEERRLSKRPKPSSDAAGCAAGR